MIKRLKTVSVIIALLNCGLSLAGDKALTNTWSSPHVVYRCTDMKILDCTKTPPYQGVYDGIY